MISIPEMDDDKSNYADRYLFSQGIMKTVIEDEKYEQSHHRVRMDISVLDVIKTTFQNSKKKMEVTHWADFENISDAYKFVGLIKGSGYTVTPLSTRAVTNKKVLMKFSHKGLLEVQSICSRTLALEKKAILCGGAYDGWEVRFGAACVGATRENPMRRRTL